MCRFISRSKSGGMLLVCAALCCSLRVAGCSAGTGDSPAGYAGYAVYAYDAGASGDVRWAEYLSSHLSPRVAEGTTVEYEGAGEGLFRIGVRLDAQLGKDFVVDRSRGEVCIAARSGDAMLWLQYQLMKRLGTEDVRVKVSDLPPATVSLRDTSGVFAFGYRGIYAPEILDTDYAGIVAAHDVERDWALWGHGLARAVGPDAPEEVYAVVDGEKYDGQYCFSSEELFRRIAAYVVDEYGEGPKRERFMIASADDAAVCTCTACLAAGNTPRNGTPAAAKLVRRLAERFPGHTFYLLAYLGTLDAPEERLPANAGAVVSALELPMRTGAFRSDAGGRFAGRLEEWRQAADSVFVWDYVNNFDDYLTPFPVWKLLGERLSFYRSHGVKGVFLNGSGPDYSSFDDVRSYLFSSLLLNPRQSPDELAEAYLTDRYPVSGGILSAYFRSLGDRMADGGRALELYGSIRQAEETYLDAGEFVRFYDRLLEILPRTEGAERERLHELLAALSYTRLELGRSHAAGRYGAAELRDDAIVVRPETERWLELLGGHETFGGMERVGEGAFTIEEYLDEWRCYVTGGRNLLAGCIPEAVSEADDGYTDLSVLTDGMPGLPGSYHYGWHIATRDLEVGLPVERAARSGTFRMTFLDAPRHRIHSPRRVELWADGKLYKTFTPVPDETGRMFTAEGDVRLAGARSIRVKALRPEGGRTQVAAGEIYLIP